MAFGDLTGAGANHVITDAGSVSTSTTTITWATTTGNSFVVGVRRGTDKGTTNTAEISWDSGSTWHTMTLAKDMPFQATDEYGAVYYYPNITGAAANATRIRVTFDVARTMRYWMNEYEGNYGVHQSNGAQGNSNGPNSGNVTTTASCCLVGYIGTGANNAITPFSPGTTNSITWTKRDENDNGTAIRVLSMDLNGAQASGTYAALGTFTGSATDLWTAIVVAFSNAGGAAQDTPELRGRPEGLRGQNQMQQLLAT